MNVVNKIYVIKVNRGNLRRLRNLHILKPTIIKFFLSLGETDLCQSLDNQKGCSNDEDVLCKLMHKVRHYLRTRYNVTDETEDGLRGPFRPRRKLLRPTPTRAMPKVIVFLGVAETRNC